MEPHAQSRGRSRGRGSRGGRGRGRGRVNPAPSGHDDTNATPPGTLDPGGVSGDSPSGDATINQGEEKGKAAVEDRNKTEAEVCFICASAVIHNAVAPCNHRTCHICSLRMRALYKTKACAHCRTESDFVIFTDDATKRYEDFTDSDFAHVDAGLGIKYEKPEIYEDTVLLLRYNCPDESCDVACLGWGDLHRHVRSAHKKVMCELCTRNKKVFTHEHELFTYPELRKHQKFGDDNPGAVDQSGFKGHPECGFCRERFYGEDELYAHCREKHERCHICDRRSQGGKPVYYRNYDELEVHFRKDHFLCPDKECLEKKFVVFESEMDLQAHQVETHPGVLSKDALRDARRVDLSGFQLREQYQPQRGGRVQGRGRGRGRDPNTEPLPASSAQPLRRDELAFQRQLALQNSPSRRTFGTSLTPASPTREAFAAAPPANAPEPAVQAARRPPNGDFPSLSSMQSTLPITNSTHTSPRPEAATTPQDHARQLRHNAVIERASNLLHNNQPKLAEFRTLISSLRNSSISASDLIDGFFSLFDCTNAELGILIKELAELFELPSKRDDLLRAWNDWKAINEDYPTLPTTNSGPSTFATTTASHGGKRVLKLKSSTAQSSRSAVSRTGSWGSAANLFPPLPATFRNGGAPSRPTGTATWASSASARPLPTSQPSSRSASKRGTIASVTDTEAFPRLPIAPKPASTVFSPGYSGSGVRRVNDTGTATNAWGSGGSAVSATTVAAVEEGVGGKKKKQGKRQTLMHFG